MNWYYVSGGQQAGPVDEAQMAGLVRARQVRGETLVWHEGMPNWLPYGQVSPGWQGAVGGPPAVNAGQPPAEVVCAECGRVFPIENTIQLGGSRICATCKPVFMQRMQEGATLQVPYAPGSLTESELLAQDYPVEIGACFQRGWE